MGQELKFRIILAALAERIKEEKEVLCSVLSAIFDVPVKEVMAVFDKLPAVLFDDISADDLKKVKDQLIFLSKLGMDFNITFKPFPELYRAKWQIKSLGPILSCPGCGEELVLLRAHDFHRYFSTAGGRASESGIADSRGRPATDVKAAKALPTPVPTKAKSEKDEDPSSEMEEVEVLSEELEAIVQREEKRTVDMVDVVDVEDVEEVGSISEEMKRVGNISSIEGIGGISAEFEEIEGVSAEFEKMSLGGLEADIGSLSAELEEIEGVSAELASMDSDTELEKIKSEPLHIISAPAPKVETHPLDEGELDEIKELSSELEKIAEPLHDELLPNLLDSEKKSPGKSPPTSKIQSPALPKIQSPAPPKAQSPVTSKTQPPAPPKAQSPVTSKIQPPAPPKVGGRESVKFPPGEYGVVINFSGKGNIQGGIQLLGIIKGISPEEAAALTKQNAGILVADKVSQETAEKIMGQFQKLKMQGRIISSRKK